MKIIQTFWTGPAVPKGNVLDIKGGWVSAEYHWMSWALSCLQLKKLYGEVELVTDELGKKILVDTLGLPYTQVSTVLEGKLNDYPPELWSLAKIVAFSEQQAPFLHFDGDFFMWQQVEPRIMEAAIVAQNLEENLSYYRDMMQDMEKHGWRMPPVLAGVSQAPVIYAVNTGIFGGHHLDFVKAYCQNAFNFINTNLDIIPKTQKNQLNFIFEQCLLYYFAKQEGVTIEYLMEDPVDEPSYADYARFVDVPQVKMIHTLGGYKTTPFTYTHMAKRLRNDFPAAYYRIISLCNGLGLKHQIYHLPPFNDPDFYPVQHQKMMQTYIGGGLQPAPINPSMALSSAQGELFDRYFARSICVASWLTQPVADTNVQAEQPAPKIAHYAALQQRIEGLEDADKRALAEEILAIESQQYLMALQLNNPVFLQQQYCKEALQYDKVQQLFTKPEATIWQATVVADPDVQIVECSRDWNFSPVDADGPFLEEQLVESESGIQVVLKIDIENGEVAELYPDSMDMVMLETCKKSISIADIGEEIKQYFDAEEIESGYEAYKKLITDTIKQLLFNGLLRLT